MTDDIGRRGPRRPGVITLLNALAFSRRGGGASELLTWRGRDSARSEKVNFPPGNPCCSRALPRRAVGCAFSGGPAKAVASVVHPPQMLSFVPMELHGFSASH